jgi:hypothetical protein
MRTDGLHVSPAAVTELRGVVGPRSEPPPHPTYPLSWACYPRW